MPRLRQQIMILYLQSPDLASGVGAWTLYDGSGRQQHTTGDSDSPPYPSVLEAMKDGWRVIQLPQQFPAYPGMEYTTSFLKFEYVLERMVEVD